MENFCGSARLDWQDSAHIEAVTMYLFSNSLLHVLKEHLV